MSNTLKPDLEQASTMLKALAPSDGAFTFQTFDDNEYRKKDNLKAWAAHGKTGKKDPFAIVKNGEFSRLKDWLTKQNNQQAGIFITVNQTDLAGRLEQNITGIRAYFVDFDNPKATRLKMLKGLENNGFIPPSLIIETSKNKHHAYWLLDTIDESKTGLEKFSERQSKLIAFFDSLGDTPDDSITDLNRVMRLAGYYHQKEKPAKYGNPALTGEAFLTKIVYQGESYTGQQLNALIDSLPAPLERTSQRQANTDTSNAIISDDNDDFMKDEPLNDLSIAKINHYLKFVDNENYNDWLTVGMALHHQFKGEHEGLDLWNEWAETAHNYLSFEDLQSRWVKFANDRRAKITTFRTIIKMVNSDPKFTGYVEPWEKLEPLADETTPATRYPIEAWQGVLGNAVKAIAHHAQIPIAMAGQCVLGALATIGQRYVNAPYADGVKFMPCSLFLLTRGASGEGKNRAVGLSHRVIKDYQKQLDLEFAERLAQWQANRLATPKKELSNFLATTPQPIQTTLFVSRGSLQGVIFEMVNNNQKAISWITSDAGQFFGGYSMTDKNTKQTIADLSEVWSEGNFDDIIKGNTGNKRAYDLRFSLDLLGQDEIIAPVLSDPVMNGQGFLPRFLYAFPDSMKGYREHNTPERMNDNSDNDPRLKAYWAKCEKLLTPPTDYDPFEQGEFINNTHRINVGFADQHARQVLADYQQWAENEMRKGGKFEHYDTYAPRLAENASRIATLMAFFDGRTALTSDDIERASMITTYSINERMRYTESPQAGENDSQKLLDWIVKRGKANHTDRLSYAEVQSKVNPKHLRQKANFELFTSVLADKGYIQIITAKNSKFIQINPALLES